MRESDFTGLQITHEETGETDAVTQGFTTTGSVINEDVQQSLPAIICMADNSRDLSTLPAPLKALAKVYKEVFLPGAIGPDGFYRSPFCFMADILRRVGLQGQYLAATLISIITMVSAKLGFSGSFMMVDTGKDAEFLVSVAEKFMPKGIIFPATDLDDKSLFMSAEELPGKVIVNDSFARLKKCLPYLEPLIETGHTAMQIPIPTFRGKKNEQVDINGQVSLITITDNPENAGLKVSAFIKMILDSEDVTCLIDKNALKEEGLRRELQSFVKAFARMVPCKVYIPFIKDLEEFAKYNRISLNMLAPLIFLVSVLTVINNTEQPSKEELMEFYLNPNYAIKGKVLTASKVEYFLAYSLLGGHVSKHGENPLTEIQERIFQVIKKELEDLFSITGEDGNSIVEKLSVLPDTERLPTMEKIIKGVNKGVKKDGFGIIPVSTINHHLNGLLKKGIIISKKLPGCNKNGFYITLMEAGDIVPLPNPSKIFDPVYLGRAVKIQNPLTGEIEEIGTSKQIAKIEGK